MREPTLTDKEIDAHIMRLLDGRDKSRPWWYRQLYRAAFAEGAKRQRARDAEIAWSQIDETRNMALVIARAIEEEKPDAWYAAR